MLEKTLGLFFDDILKLSLFRNIFESVPSISFFLDLIVENGYSLLTYFSYSILNIFGIAPKFFPLAFLLSIIIFITRHNNSEFIILWSSGVKKIILVNLLLLSSFIVVIFYLFFSTFITPLTLNKARLILSQSQFNSFLPTVKAQQFSDSFKGFTFFVEKKINNEIQNIFLHDTGKNLKNFSSNISNTSSTTVLAEKGIIKDKELFLINGEVITNKQSSKESDVVRFEQLSINLNELNTTVIKQPKLQETSTLKLLSCVFKKSNAHEFCNKDSIKEIIPALARRLVLPIYIPVLVLFSSMLLINSKSYFANIFSIFLYCFSILIFAELILKYTGYSNLLKFIYIFAPIISFFIVYPYLIYRFSK